MPVCVLICGYWGLAGRVLYFILKIRFLSLRCVIPVVCRKTHGEVNISHESTTMIVWIYDGI